jgi:hypothetical protein
MTALPQEQQISSYEVAIASGVRSVIDAPGFDWMGPNQPQPAIAPQGTMPRTWDYPFGYNLYFYPRGESSYQPGFEALRLLALYDIVRLCIETRKQQILEMPQAWRIARETGESDSDYKKRTKGKQTSDERIRALNTFFKNPDKDPRHSFLSWMNMVVEEILVTDALSIWPVMGDDGSTISYRLIDGCTIKPLIDPQGWTPAPPNAAYSQIIKGSPSIQLTAGLCSKCAVGRPCGKCVPLVYRPFNVTVNSITGFSPVQQIMRTIVIGMNRMTSQASLYTEGNVPECLISLADQFQVDQIKQFQGLFDQVAGDIGLKRRVRFIPEVKSITQTKDPMIKDDRDDWLARVCCYALSVAPNALVKQMNRASSQQIQQSAIEEGKLPTLGRISELLTYMIHVYGVGDYSGDDLADIEHAYDTSAQSDPNVQSQINDRDLRNGSKCINEVRDATGQEPVPGGERFMIYLPTGPILLQDAGMQPQVPQNGQNQPQGSVNAVGGTKLPATTPKRLKSPENANGGGLTDAQRAEAKKMLKLLPAPVVKRASTKFVY